MNKTIKIIISLIVIAIVIFFAFGSNDTKTSVVKVGAIFPLTGSNATYGEMAKKAIDLALTELDMKNIEVVYEDSQFQSVPALNAYQKLKSQGVQYFFTIGSQVGLTVGAKAREDNLFNFELTAVTPKYRDNSSLTCRAALTADVSSKALADHLEQNKLTKLALFVTNDEQGLAYETNMRQLVSGFGGSIVSVEKYQVNDIDFRTQITRITASKPEALLLIAPGQQAETILRQLRELKFRNLIISNNFTIANASLHDLSLADGVVFSDYAFGADQKGTGTEESFIEKFQNSYKQNPPIVSATAYDAIHLFKSALDYGKNDPLLIGNYLSSVQGYNGVSGSLSFDGDCEARQEAVLKIVKNGQFIKLK